jgi:L-serine/L-threonine ammonia-lyase
VVVSDRSAAVACERFLSDHRLLVEPACGASLAVAYERRIDFERLLPVLMIVCGGATCTLDQLLAWARA